MGITEFIASLLIGGTLAGLTGGAAIVVADQLDSQVSQMNQTLKTGIDDFKMVCAVKVVGSLDAAQAVLNDPFSPDNAKMMEDIQACNGVVSDGQRLAATGEPKWLQEQLQEMDKK